MTDAPSTKRDSAGIHFPPPVLLLVPFLIGLFLDRYLSRFQPSASLASVLGSLLTLAGLALSLSALSTLRRYRTSLRTDRSSSVLVAVGLFCYSRNPTYLGFVTLYLGAALLLRSPGALLLWPASILLLQIIVIRSEELYLTRRFGPLYLSYKAKVRRWL